jgi:hypothetical protein
MRIIAFVSAVISLAGSGGAVAAGETSTLDEVLDRGDVRIRCGRQSGPVNGV